jgi:septum formation protein
LGSASPRRREILRELGIPVRILPPEVPEPVLPGDTPASFLQRVVEDKITAVLAALTPGELYSCALAADTIVLIDGEILGKPVDSAAAVRLLSKLVGRTHEVQTRYALSGPGLRPLRRTVCSQVTLRSATVEEITRYAETGEGLDKAGAYAVQGMGTFLVESIQGSYTNVVGLPACELVRDLKDLGVLPRFPL